MDDSKFPVPISKVEKAIQGPPLTQEIVTCFEQSYSSFLAMKDRQEVTAEVIDEIANLLTVSQKNLEEVQNQKWFQRAWYTITGKNKKLERVSQTNLLKVQKGALFFLQNLAETNRKLMETVSFALKRVEDIQIDSAKLNGYLIQVIQKYNKKLGHIEERLNQHEKAILDLQERRSKYWLLFCSIIAVILGIGSIFYLPANFNWIMFGCFFLLGVTFLLLTLRRTQNVSSSLITSTSRTISQTHEANNKLLSEVGESLYSLFVNFVNENLIGNPIVEFSAKHNGLLELYQELNSDGLEKPTIASIVNNILSIEPVSNTSFIHSVQYSSSLFCDFHRRLVSGIQSEFLPDSVGLDVLTSLDFQFQSSLTEEIIDAVSPYSAHIENIIQMRRSLLTDLNRFNQLMNESDFVAFGKGFLEGLNFGILFAPASDDEDFVKKFVELLLSYMQQWNYISQVIFNSVLKLNAKTYDEAIRYAIHKMQPMFEEFNNRDVSLLPLLNQLRNGSNE